LQGISIRRAGIADKVAVQAGNGKRLCQGEGRGEVLVAVFVHEDGELSAAVSGSPRPRGAVGQLIRAGRQPKSFDRPIDVAISRSLSDPSGCEKRKGASIGRGVRQSARPSPGSRSGTGAGRGLKGHVRRLAHSPRPLEAMVLRRLYESRAGFAFSSSRRVGQRRSGGKQSGTAAPPRGISPAQGGLVAPVHGVQVGPSARLSIAR